MLGRTEAKILSSLFPKGYRSKLIEHSDQIILIIVKGIKINFIKDKVINIQIIMIKLGKIQNQGYQNNHN